MKLMRRVTICDKWRGDALLNLGSKIFARCLFERLREPVETILRKPQAGFRSGRSCKEQILVVRKLIEEAIENQEALVVSFMCVLSGA